MRSKFKINIDNKIHIAITIILLLFGSISIGLWMNSCGNAPPLNIPKPTPTETSLNSGNAEKASGDLKSKVIRDSFKVIADNSQTLIGWCLAIFGGTILALISTSYLRPADKRARLIYLFFIPGWVFLGLSVYSGNLLARAYMTLSSKYDADEKILVWGLIKSGWNIEYHYDYQLKFLQIGMVIFGAWILSFLVWWIFGNWSSSDD